MQLKLVEMVSFVLSISHRFITNKLWCIICKKFFKQRWRWFMWIWRRNSKVPFEIINNRQIWMFPLIGMLDLWFFFSFSFLVLLISPGYHLFCFFHHPYLSLLDRLLILFPKQHILVTDYHSKNSHLHRLHFHLLNR